MTSLLRQLVAGPRARHPEAKLDLCYVTENIIVTSGPAVTYPSLAYRNPLDRLIGFIHSRHSDEWCIFEFRAEGTGYKDKDVHGRIRHFPWPDHHPPPFGLMPDLLESMRYWLGDEDWRPPKETSYTHIEPKSDATKDIKPADPKKRVAILHCKAGKGRSGTVACSYMIAIRGWDVEEALARFTERRMRPGWGAGISIKSQRRWIGYVERWGKYKAYTERKVKIIEVRLWGRRESTRILIRGFVENGKKIKVLHTWAENEGENISLDEDTTSDKPSQSATQDPKDDQTKPPQVQKEGGPQNPDFDIPKVIKQDKADAQSSAVSKTKQQLSLEKTSSGTTTPTSESSPPPNILTILRPEEPLIIATQDVNVEIEKTNRSYYGLPTVVTSTAHSWFNAFFEGNGPEQEGKPTRSGTYTIEWDAMDGLKGSSRRGVRAVEKVSVVWEILDDEDAAKEEEVIEQIHEQHKQAKEEKQDEGSKVNIVEGDAEGDSEPEEGLQTFVEPGQPPKTK